MLPRTCTLKKLAFLFILSGLVLCVRAQKITGFRFEKSLNPSLNFTINCTIYNDSEIIGLVPFNTPVTGLIASYETSSEVIAILVENEGQESGVTANDFNTPRSYVASTGSENRLYKVNLVYTGLPSLFIYTDNEDPVVSKDVYVSGTITVYPDATAGMQMVFTETMQIKGRGNTTWDMPKKPYKIKLSKKSSLLGMPADKEWVLLANYADKSLLRTVAAFETSKHFGMEYTPNAQSVDVFLNDMYLGTYVLTEQIKIAPGRVNIHEMKSVDTAPEDITGGYLLEVDERLDEDLWFRTSRGVPFTVKEPSLNAAQFDYIRQYVQQAEDALYGSNFTDPDQGYATFINTESFVNWYLINELFKNNDAIFFSSVYMVKDKNGKLSLGPVWDFDIAAGNINYNNNDLYSGWWIRNAAWINRMFQDPAFKERVKVRWNELKTTGINTLPAYIQSQANRLDIAQQYNFKKWNILNVAVWPNPVITGSYVGEVDYLKTWLNNRIAWIDAQINPKPFSLKSPANQAKVVLDTKKYATVQFNWKASPTPALYKFMLSVKASQVPVIYGRSQNNGVDSSMVLTSQMIILPLQQMGYGPGDSVTLNWKVFAVFDSDSLASSEEFELNVKIRETLSPFHLAAPGSNELTDVSQNPDQRIRFSWESSTFATAYKPVFLNSLGKVLAVDSVEHNNTDTFCSVSKRTWNSLVNLYGTSYTDSTVLKAKWTVYAYRNNTDSLKAVEINNINFYQLDPEPERASKTVNLALPLNDAQVFTTSTDSSLLRFTWKPDSNSTGLRFKFICTELHLLWDEPLVEKITKDTFIDFYNHEFNALLRSTGLSKGDSTTLKWTVYTYLEGDPDSAKANQTFVLNLKWKRQLSAFSIISPAENSMVITYHKDSFPGIRLEWQKAGTSAAIYYKVISKTSAVVAGESLSAQNGLESFADLDNRDLAALAASDSLRAEYTVIAFDGQEDSLVCNEPADVWFVREKVLSGVSEQTAAGPKLRVYPNPADGRLLYVTIEGTAKGYRVELLDFTGKLVYDIQEYDASSGIDISALNSGIYFCRVSGEGFLFTHKVIVQR